MRASSWFLPLIVLLVIAVDQASKAVALYTLNEYETIPLIPNFFHLTLVHNTGIAFGLFHGGSKLLLLAILAGILILFFLAVKMRNESILHRLCLGFILGGAVGNLIDRLTRGAVIDFLDFRIWPVFNLADSFITVGVIILIFSIIKTRKT